MRSAQTRSAAERPFGDEQRQLASNRLGVAADALVSSASTDLPLSTPMRR